MPLESGEQRAQVTLNTHPYCSHKVPHTRKNDTGRPTESRAESKFFRAAACRDHDPNPIAALRSDPGVPSSAYQPTTAPPPLASAAPPSSCASAFCVSFSPWHRCHGHCCCCCLPASSPPSCPPSSLPPCAHCHCHRCWRPAPLLPSPWTLPSPPPPLPSPPLPPPLLPPLVPPSPSPPPSLPPPPPPSPPPPELLLRPELRSGRLRLLLPLVFLFLAAIASA